MSILIYCYSFLRSYIYWRRPQFSAISLSIILSSYVAVGLALAVFWRQASSNLITIYLSSYYSNESSSFCNKKPSTSILHSNMFFLIVAELLCSF